VKKGGYNGIAEAGWSNGGKRDRNEQDRGAVTEKSLKSKQKGYKGQNTSEKRCGQNSSNGWRSRENGKQTGAKTRSKIGFNGKVVGQAPNKATVTKNPPLLGLGRR